MFSSIARCLFCLQTSLFKSPDNSDPEEMRRINIEKIRSRGIIQEFSEYDEAG